MQLDDYAASQDPPPGRRRQATPTPPWQPGLHHDGNTGELTTGPVEGDSPDWVTIFAHWNLDPDDWHVVDGSLRVNAWEGPTSEGAQIFRQYKATVRRRTTPAVDVDHHLQRLAKWRPRKPPTAGANATWVVCFADWQVGGRGDAPSGATGSAAFLERFEATLAQLNTMARTIAKQCDTLACLFLGDMVENVQGNYSSQPFEVDLSLRDQIRMVRQCETLALRTLAPHFAQTIAVAVAGNHGRGNSKVVTTPEDNADLMAFEAVAEVLTASGAAEQHNITFIAPEQRSVALVETSGTNLLLAHGDQISGNADRIKSWWQRTALNRWGDADLGDICISGHRHHTRVEEVAVDRWVMVCPTLGGESRWFGEVGGDTSKPGTLTFVTANKQWWAMNNVQPWPNDTPPPPQHPPT